MEFKSKLFPSLHSCFFIKWSRIGPCFFSFIFSSIIVLVYYGRGLQYCPQVRSEPEQVKPLSGYEMSPFAPLSETNGSCDLFVGKWVWDNILTHPLYNEQDCPYIDSQLSCRANGRPDNSYQFWRWQPDGCDLPRFNASLILESIRGKKMMFVGDSLNRGQFFSMVCLVQSLIPEGQKSLEQHDSLVTFRAKRYNATIEYYWAPFLLESNSDDIFAHKSSEKIVRNNSIEKHGVDWRGADVMIFNTYAWWLWDIKIIEGLFDEESKNSTKLSIEEGYRLGIKSMIDWVEKNMDSNKTRVFFTSMSPNHAISGEWGANDGGNCYNETTIIEEKTYWGTDCRKSMMQVIKDEFIKSEYPITLLNITQLSSYRKDAHVSIYKKHWTPLSPEQVADPVGYADCLHFCLPGLQDTWNELLFTKLFYP